MQEVKQTSFFILDNDNLSGEYKPAKVEGELLDIIVHGYRFFVHESIHSNTWTVSEFQTGGQCSSGYNKKRAVENFKATVATYPKNKLSKAIDPIVEKYGIINK